MVWRGDRVLLIRRGKPPRAGQWSLPGGAQQLGETLREAMTREVREETGLELTDVRLLTTVDLIEREPDGRVRYHYTLVDFTAEAPDGRAGGGRRRRRGGWFALDELAGLGLWSETLRIIGEAAALRGGPRTAVVSPWLLGEALAVGEHAGEVAQGVLVLAAADAGEVAGELQQHALLRHQLAGLGLVAPLGIDVLEEVADLDPQRLGDLVQPAGRDAVDAGLVLVGLLVGHADQLGHLLLGQARA